ncbi:ABC transporter permease [Natronosporangium hydrolyticum]|uniref:Transport permease protein n=1 Tax=Natronosporangium hydrolyticum TaxID=2811111 RepID=A0A895YPS5_9ACTN|nr:ABC transporter permease [Natronosporangium hydrolyticum]QSB16736.1 ABC transporter permease [Natronosporangium hydrolyticum]
MPHQAVVASMRVHLVNTLARPIFQVMLLIQPITMVLLTYYVYGRVDGAGAFYVVLGSGMAGMWVATAFSSAGDLGRERRYGTILPVLLADASLWLVSAGRAMGALVLSLIPIVISSVAAVLLFGVPLPGDLSVPWVLVGIAVYGLACHSFGLLLGTLFLLSRRTTVLQNFLEWPLLVASGVLFPVTALPAGAQGATAVVPMRWAAQATEQAFTTGTLDLRALGLALSSAGIALAAAVVLFRVIERRVRVTASLELA